MAKVRLVDVAAHAGVSKSTVSQFLSGRFDYMSKDTKARIEASVAALNYVPNAIARSLKTNTTKTIGLVVRDVTGFYTSRTIRGIDDFCKNSQYNVLIYSTDFDPKKEAEALQNLSQINVDGIVIAPSGANTALIDKLLGQGLPIVQFQLEQDGTEKYIILSDYKKAAFEATEYLLNLGHRKICFVTQEFEAMKSRRDRYQGYCEALEAQGVAYSKDLILHWQRETGFSRSPVDLLRSEVAPTAFFSQHLAITIELLEVFNRHNIAIGQDVSLLGFDDIPMVEFFKTPVTVIKQEPYDIGQEAAKLLLTLINQKETPAQRITTPCTLVPRDSCRKLN
ncbi:LacI family transcriptional regulator [Gilvimarinus agarilyticus]|uniref:LacI family DNA-binding transcriptional regulator n=1 Tax=unclassified Gilvimarinus TaxID=2642066 RepID=UPI001C0865E3|nr:MULTISPECIES: LacI family DNA-binding transcriptional regulator [unclassified Gilvimarinus]MBU2884388.1 LacI family transcriptional regulator [Gilvimarinus agarilyticus]MDO6569524.1 LacI family DNA-binding transcriptional regulator [Gilvimarinus sp. 2_MG-2023]MDO6748150.1 LacI family DNA-binding transcriptional regulator [Gilvimarinus sp. 1_MG-2023]